MFYYRALAINTREGESQDRGNHTAKQERERMPSKSESSVKRWRNKKWKYEAWRIIKHFVIFQWKSLICISFECCLFVFSPECIWIRISLAWYCLGQWVTCGRKKHKLEERYKEAQLRLWHVCNQRDHVQRWIHAERLNLNDFVCAANNSERVFQGS